MLYRNKLVRSLGIGILLALISSCGSSGGDAGGGEEPPEGTIIGLPIPEPYGSGAATILEGTWVLNCIDSVHLNPLAPANTNFIKGVTTYTGNGLSATGASYSESTCTQLISSSTSKSDIEIGNATTSTTGLAATEINITPVESTVNVPGVGPIVTTGGPTSYVIFRLDGDRLYHVVLDINSPGNSETNRARTLNPDYFQIRNGSTPGPIIPPAQDGIAISTAAEVQVGPMIVADGNGGAIMAWQDFRDGGITNANADIYAQHIDASNNVNWTENGVLICAAANNQGSHQIVSDGNGGAIIVWMDKRDDSADVYAQRIQSNGTVSWDANGVAIAAALYSQSAPQVVSDGSGGAIIVWTDTRNLISTGDTGDIYAQHINAQGAVTWTENGIVISSATNKQHAPQLAGDGSGGAIIVWEDSRAGVTDANIYAQHVDISGAVSWAGNGIAVTSTTAVQFRPIIVADGSGGAIIAWRDRRNVDSVDIYAQHIDSNGALTWAGSDVPVTLAAGDQLGGQITTDGNGGAVVVWQNELARSDIYTQRIDNTGAVSWVTDGVKLNTPETIGVHPKITTGNNGSTYVSWWDGNIYGQHIDNAGNLLWSAENSTIALKNPSGILRYPELDVDGNGGAIIVWNADSDVYAGTVSDSGPN